MPRAGPRLAHGLGTKTGVKTQIPRHDDATVGESHGRPKLRRITFATIAFAADGQAQDLAHGPQQLGQRVAKLDTTKNPGDAMCSWLPESEADRSPGGGGGKNKAKQSKATATPV